MAVASRAVYNIASSECAVRQVHAVQYQPTNRPIEDRLSVDQTQDGRLFVGVYDGHHGAATAAYVSQTLPAAVLSHPPQSTSPADAVTSHLMKTFTDLDESILSSFQRDFEPSLPKLLRRFGSNQLPSPAAVTKALRDANVLERARRAKCGSTALGVYVVGGKDGTAVYLANLGDCRAVLGQMDAEGRVEAVPLTRDLNVKDPLEVARLRNEHPGEDDTVIMGGRVLGLIAVTRSFGDAYFKLHDTSYTFKVLGHPFLTPPGQMLLADQHRVLFGHYRTPPYLSSTPEVTTRHPLEGGRNRFIVVGSDGLWDLVSDEWAVRAVMDGLERGGKEENVSEFVLQRILEAGKRPGDDLTCVVLVFR